MRVVEKIASQSLARAASGASLGNMAAAQAGVARADDGPVDLVARDELERGAIGLRDGAIGAADLIGILVREQRGIALRQWRGARRRF